MKTITTALILLSIVGCTSTPSKPEWGIAQSVQNGHTLLFVTSPSQKTSFKVVDSLYSIPQYAIADNGRYIAYISKERAKDPELFVQELGNAFRISLAQVKDTSGRLEFKADSIAYKSKSENLVIKLEDVSRKIREKFAV